MKHFYLFHPPGKLKYICATCNIDTEKSVQTTFQILNGRFKMDKKLFKSPVCCASVCWGGWMIQASAVLCMWRKFWGWCQHSRSWFFFLPRQKKVAKDVFKLILITLFSSFWFKLNQILNVAIDRIDDLLIY